MKFLLLAGLFLSVAAHAADPGIEAFNKAFNDATLHMDSAAALALWEDDGATLMPMTAAVVGKKALGEFLDSLKKQFPGAQMKTFEMQCGGLDQIGDVASEWCLEHQVVDLGNGKAPFEGRGRMLLVLHRGADGKWRLRREMWQTLGSVSGSNGTNARNASGAASAASAGK
jgi:ketosteroid isomerase-like protein